MFARSISSTICAVAFLSFVCVAAGPADAGTYSLIFQFDTPANGLNPAGGVVVDTDGTIYGMTSNGGTHGCGTVYALQRPAAGSGHWTQKVIYQIGTDAIGCFPVGTPVIQGDFVEGTTTGMHFPDRHDYPGTVFRVRKAGGAHTILHLFDMTKKPEEGVYPKGGVLVEHDGQRLFAVR